MNSYLAQVSAAARNAAYRKDWATVHACASEILQRDDGNAEGHFLAGLVSAAAGRPDQACASYSAALEADDGRHDAAIELADQYCAAQRHADAVALVDRYLPLLSKSPRYLHMAGTVYSRAGLAEKAWELFSKADELQPGIHLFQSSLATCAVFLGKVDKAAEIYSDLLRKAPTHQRHHHQFSQLRNAKDESHIEQMRSIVETSGQPAERNVFLLYAIAKEYEDLGEWEMAFEHYRQAGDAVQNVADYDVRADVSLIDTIIGTCTDDWINAGQGIATSSITTPIFLVGLPRTGTTLTERIVSSHSAVSSVDETQYMQMSVKRASGVQSEEKMTPEMIVKASEAPSGEIGADYLSQVSHRLGSEPMFIDKLPFNILYLGFIAREFPEARIILMQRNPMDSCFAIYKQVFAGAYKFSYSLDNLATFYIAYARLAAHWRSTLGDRLVEVHYESLVADQQGETRSLVRNLGIDFEDSCLDFVGNKSAITTASSVQVRSGIHGRSVHRWKRYERQLAPLRARLEAAGITVE